MIGEESYFYRHTVILSYDFFDKKWCKYSYSILKKKIIFVLILCASVLTTV